MLLPSTTATSIILFSVLFISANGSSMSSLVTVACQRDPTLSFCKPSGQPPISAAAGVPTSILRASSVPVALSENDKILLEDIAAAVQRAGGNPFDKQRRVVRQGERKDTDLREKEEKEEGFIAEEGEHTQSRHPIEAVEEPVTPNSTSAPIVTTTEDTEEVQGFKGEKAEYCDNYEQHFSFYCVGEHSSDQESAGKFCKSYKKACPSKKVTTGTGITEWPADPFTGKSGSRVKSRGDIETEVEEEDHEATEQELYYTELKKRFPCKPDCDPRVFPHCTAECKCDYIYPTVQRFCNPPPMPLFLNTCRLWYNGCPKYDAYHYASQFVYSKAEKGKVLPGIANNVNPYGIPQPALRAPFRTEGAATQLRPLAHAAPTAQEEILFIPPPLPPGYKEKIRANRTRSERIDVFEQVTRRNRERKRRRRITKKRSNRPATPAPPTKRELYRTLKALSALTADPTRLTKDIIGQGGGDSPNKPRAYQAANFPVIPSDAAYGAGDDPFRKFDGLTDSRGILHRPRSSSPFTKPGLWAANPDDPHNRDHANKYYYHPESVGVDWLNGQLQWGAHWAVPAAQVGGTNGFSTVHFPTIGNFLNIPDDYD